MLQLVDSDLDRLQERNPHFHPSSYDFVIQALNVVLQQLQQPRHVSAQELADGVRILALARYGILARQVLEYWGIRDSDDVGRVVFAMVELGILVMEDGDRIEDFSGAFDFEHAFEQNYPWTASGETRH